MIITLQFDSASFQLIVLIYFVVSLEVHDLHFFVPPNDEFSLVIYSIAFPFHSNNSIPLIIRPKLMPFPSPTENK